ncbi:MAG: 3-dehydroquinate synthase [Bacteroidia bacterium]|nr:3-dehydroquinate synthase [Bacteroidia bacterium]
MNTVIDNKSYKIHLTNNFEQVLVQFIAINTYSAVVYLFDDNTHRLYGSTTYFKNKKIIIIAPGETNKNITTCAAVWQQLLAHNADRNILLVNVGGGLVSDLGGFVASTYKRGVHFINIPTTLLACVDASIGGKTGINTIDAKNMIGTFCNPQLVIIDTHFFNTLPQQELLSGFGEIIKHGLITNATYFDECNNLNLNNTTLDWYPIIATSLHIKKNIVAQDFEERNLRKTLNAGHTVGHALETMLTNTSTTHYTHGECIAVGLLIEAYIAKQQQLLAAKDFIIIENCITKYYAVKNILSLINNWEAFNNTLYNDKKNTIGTINASLLTSIGTCQINSTITTHEIKNAIAHYCN